MQKTLVLLVALLGLAVSQNVYSEYCQFDACEATLEESLTCNFDSVSVTATYGYSDWTQEGLLSWSVSSDNVPVDGVCEEYSQWNVMTKEDWYSSGDSGDNFQDRDSAFAEGTCGNLQIADGDNYNCHVTGGSLNTKLTSDPVDITGAAPGSVFLVLSESYRDYSNQQKTIYYSLDGGEEQVLTQVVDESPDWTQVTNLVSVPTTADNSSVSFSLEFIDNENGWWWAVGQVGVVSLGCEAGDFVADAEGLSCVEATVQEPTEEPTEFSSDCVVVFSECNFSGDSVEICDENEDIDIDVVKSIYVPENCTFYFYDEVSFGGQEVALTESVECNEETASFFALLAKHKRFLQQKRHQRFARHHQKRQQHQKISGKFQKK